MKFERKLSEWHIRLPKKIWKALSNLIKFKFIYFKNGSQCLIFVDIIKSYDKDAESNHQEVFTLTNTRDIDRMMSITNHLKRVGW